VSNILECRRAISLWQLCWYPTEFKRRETN